MSNTVVKFPVGSSVAISDFHTDPYGVYSQLLSQEPITWIEGLGMYLVVGYEQIRTVLMDTKNFSTGTEHSTIFDTFGEHMLTVDGADHERYKGTVRSSFMPKLIRERMEDTISCHVDRLIDSVIEVSGEDKRAELRSSFASRLPVLTTLSLFGLPIEDEKYLRRWYNSFEQALANFTWDEKVRAASHQGVAEFHEYLQSKIDACKEHSGDSLLDVMVSAYRNDGAERLLTDDEIKRNASIIFFGGISTVEALLLNCLYALSMHQDIFERVRGDYSLIPRVIDETLRWRSPVQSATRHVTGDVSLGGVSFKKGDTVNCMIAAGNRDPSMFANPGVFDIDREKLNRHMAFAYGPHHCLGSNLARVEARIGLERLMSRLPNCQMDVNRPTKPEGYEFHQPREFFLVWD